MRGKTINLFTIPCIFFFLASFLIACSGDDTESIVPKINFIALTKTKMTQGDFFEDSLRLILSFEDGDGDLGFPQNDNRYDITLIDSRNNQIQDQYKLPPLPDSEGRAQKGQMSLLVYTSCCLFKDQIPPCSAPPQYPLDSLIYKIILRDRSGHTSDTVYSDKVYLKCI
ncbi:MAG: hypothetical protein JNL65_11245 [Saprospiraceae bacterium]|nr:hypothetical protein [Saprospiraceae bacterium]